MESVQNATTMILEKIGLHLELVSAHCPIHGPFKAFRSINPFHGGEYISKCPTCQNEKEEKERRTYLEQSEDPEVVLASKIEQSGIPKNYREASFCKLSTLMSYRRSS